MVFFVAVMGCVMKKGGRKKGNRRSGGSSLKKSNASTNPGKIVKISLFSLNLDRVATDKHMKEISLPLKCTCKAVKSSGNIIIMFNFTSLDGH